MTRLPIKTKETAIKLRNQGFSLKEISIKLHIAKSTASIWVANLKLDEDAKERLENLGILGQYKTILIREKRRNKLLRNLEINAKKNLNGLTKTPEFYKLMCSIMYWCEGSKDLRSGIKFINSDPIMIKTFLKFLRKGYKIDNNKLRGLVHLHQYHNEVKQIKFWSDITGIPTNQFNKSYQKPNTGKRVKENYQGCLSIRYFDVKVARELWAYYQQSQFF